jgi:energy-coupling factor transporter ATP-binding protein EcfA2
MKISVPLTNALKLPGGARFYRCALQVNPFAYLKRHNKSTAFRDEGSYNAAIVHTCKSEGVEVIGVTDHYRIKDSQKLIDTARQAGLFVFAGFEAKTKDGVHFLCLLDPSVSMSLVEAKIHDCGIHDESQLSPTGKYDTGEFLSECNQWKVAACIAAHVAADDGLLRVLKGQSRIAAWRDENLLACSLPGSIDDAPEDLRPILRNKNPDYKRERPVAVLNSQDVSDPAALKRPGASCWIKMSSVSIEGLRQAFLDPESRIRLASDPVPESHSEFVAITWEGGFLDAAAIHFNENLNVLVGGRGSGKSTVVESLRYVLQLEPVGEEAKNVHEGITRHVLKSGTKISLVLRSCRPNKREYAIERTVPNPPVVKDELGSVLALTPSDIIPGVEVFGQHEISELAKSPEKRTRLLDRFMEPDTGLVKRKSDLKRELERSRTRVLDLRKELQQIEERLATLPALEETLKRYRELGLEEKLKEQSLLVREERLLRSAQETLEPAKIASDALREAFPIDTAFVSPQALEALPGKQALHALEAVLIKFNKDAAQVSASLDKTIKAAEISISGTRAQWEERKKTVQGEYEKTLRDLQKSKIDGEEFLRLRRQIEDLRPLRERKAALLKDEQAQIQHRRNLTAEWEDFKREEFQRLERAGKKVNRQLSDLVRVRVEFSGNREPLMTALKEIGGRLSETLDVLRKVPDFSLAAFTASLRTGRDDLVKRFLVPPAQAERLAQAGDQIVMQIEELELPPIMHIELNVAAEGQAAEWRTLEGLSTGQKATAVLLLLLLESEAPLIVDQPEDDLDNRFITEGVVPKMREEKRRRQFILATHNANIPVLGDAELILGLFPKGEAGQGRAELPSKYMGSIDSRAVQDLVEDVLEGGKEAFETRRKKYGF